MGTEEPLCVGNDEMTFGLLEAEILWQMWQYICLSIPLMGPKNAFDPGINEIFSTHASPMDPFWM